MNVNEELQSFRNRFRYKSDAEDVWTVLKEPTGPVHGDCDDFALTSLWIVAGHSWLRMLWWVTTFQACMWYTRSPKGGGHAMLWVKGYGWTDNWYPVWNEKPQHPRYMPWVLPVFVLALILKPVRSKIKKLA